MASTLPRRLLPLTAAFAAAAALCGSARAAGPVFAVVSIEPPPAEAAFASSIFAVAPATAAPAATAPPVTAPAPTAPTALTVWGSSLGAQAASLALTFVGVPYVWGGESPSGVDCSGLTMYVYGKVGVKLSHWTGHQWNEGRSIPWAEMQPGDLIFFDVRSGAPQHMGMYIGNGLMVHAPRRGTVVQVVPLSQNNYAGRFARAVRPY